MPDFSAKIILVTGASRGIGLAVCSLLAKRGALVILASRDAAKAQSAASQAGCDWVQLDITAAESISAAGENIRTKYGRLDVLVNNSAILLDHYQGITQLPPEALAETFQTNVIGTLQITKALLPLLEKSKDPRIVNVSSGAGQMEGEPQAWAPAYSISKSALNMLTQQLTAALPGIATNSMCPGWCRTEMGGSEAPRSAEEGADTIVWLALDADVSLRGSFFRDRQRIAW